MAHLRDILCILTLVTLTSAQLRVVCYYGSWSSWRSGDLKYEAEKIDTNLCTHVTYAFASLDSSTLRLKPASTELDVNLNMYKRVTALKKKQSGLKVLLALGGWTDTSGNKYSRLVNSANNRKNFINDVIPLLKQYGFDGLDLDWEFPKCWQADCNKGPTSDKENFANFVAELRTAFNKQSPKLLLTAAVSASKYIIDHAYNMRKLAQNLDFINVMAYDFYWHGDGKTGHHAQMFPRPSSDIWENFNIDFAMKYWVKNGASPSQLNMGMPLFGRTYTLASKSSNGLGAKTTGPGKAGPITNEAGYIGYLEVCENIKKGGWEISRDSKIISPYATKDNQWIAYDDPTSIAKKAEYIKNNGYGGAKVWDITLDDFRGRCCSVKNPMLSAMNYVLRGKGTSASSMQC